MTPAEALRDVNVQAFLRLIRERESSQDTSAYTIINGGAHFTSFAAHPFAGLSTTQGGKAAGAYQFIPSTWAEVAKLYGLPDFSPASQDIGAVGRLIYRGALEDVIAGRIETAIAKCRLEWTSLPGAGESSAAWTMAKAIALYQAYGGLLTPQPALASKADVIRKQEPSMDPLSIMSIIGLFAPALKSLLPQVATLFPGASDKIAATQPKLDALTAILQTLVNVTQGPQTLVSTGTVGAAIDAMQKDKATQTAVQQAVVTHPDIINALTVTEIGGGVAAARAADLVVMQQEKPFWKTSAVFWISILLLPMVFWYVGASIVGGVTIPEAWPWYAQLPLKLFGGEWDAGAKVGLANLVVGLVLGGIVGVYFGVSVTQAKQQGQDKAAAQTG